MNALREKSIEKALFISPVVNMEVLILRMMSWANVSEEELQQKGEIPTSFGETLSWQYLCYARQNPIRWKTKTAILYGEQDHLVERPIVERFAREIDAPLTVMPKGEHWFHTEEQMRFLDDWFCKNTR